jgi:AcrR family transcriptional regulator
MDLTNMAYKNDTVAATAPIEMTTKERIFEVALDLFSQKGYDAVSMREIAEAVGIKKASLYSHFSSKDDLLEQIFNYPSAALSSIGPEGEDAEKMIVSMGVEGFMTMASGVFNRWMATPRMEKIWRIVCIELYHDERMKQFFNKFIGDAMAFWLSNFEIMRKHKLIKRLEPEVLAQEYLSFYMCVFMDYFIVNYDSANSFLEAEGKRLEDHTAFLVKSIKA